MTSKLKIKPVRSLVAVAVLLLLMAWGQGNLSRYYIKILHFWGIYVILGATLWQRHLMRTIFPRIFDGEIKWRMRFMKSDPETKSIVLVFPQEFDGFPG